MRHLKKLTITIIFKTCFALVYYTVFLKSPECELRDGKKKEKKANDEFFFFFLTTLSQNVIERFVELPKTAMETLNFHDGEPQSVAVAVLWLHTPYLQM